MDPSSSALLSSSAVLLLSSHLYLCSALHQRDGAHAAGARRRSFPRQSRVPAAAAARVVAARCGRGGARCDVRELPGGAREAARPARRRPEGASDLICHLYSASVAISILLLCRASHWNGEALWMWIWMGMGWEWEWGLNW